VKLPGDVTVMHSRIGPGVFFALFGALIVGASLALPIQFSTLTTQATPIGVRQEVRNVSGVGERSGPTSTSLHQSDASETERLTIREQLRFLNQVPNLLDATLSEDRRQRVQQGVRDAKLRLMKSVWRDGWGQYDQFAAWAEGGTQPPDSRAFLAAREYFETGKE
jgi:hypothetical protein